MIIIKLTLENVTSNITNSEIITTAIFKAGMLPYDQLPVLEVDRQIYGQSYAILTFAGKLSGCRDK